MTGSYVGAYDGQAHIYIDEPATHGQTNELIDMHGLTDRHIHIHGQVYR